MEKFKICPVCGMHNKPNMIECMGCETDLTSVKATDEETELAKGNNKQAENPSIQPTEEYVRVCDCGCVNTATAKKCVECGEDISDIAPILQQQCESCKYAITSLDDKFVYEIKPGTVVVGREHEMKEYLSNKLYVSRQHAKITREDNNIYIENLSNTILHLLITRKYLRKRNYT